MAGSSEVAIRCRGVTRTFGEGDARVAALRGVNLEVARGELLMLVGPSGCGKTTLVSILAGILDADSGMCEVLGQDLALLDEVARARFRSEFLGFVFQAFNLLPALTVLDNVSIPFLLRGRPRREAEAAATRALASVGLGDRLHALPSKLSGGQQQRAAIARALVHDPRLIICDEPTSNLDYQAGQDMMELLGNVARSPDRTLVIVTHDERIFHFADRIARMEDGRIVQADQSGPADGVVALAQ